MLLESGADPNAANNVSDSSTVVYWRNSTVEGMWAGQSRAGQCSVVQGRAV